MSSAVSACIVFTSLLYPAWTGALPPPVERPHQCQDMFLPQSHGFEREVICSIDDFQKYSASVFPNTYYNFNCGSAKHIITEHVKATLGLAGSLDSYFFFENCPLPFTTYADIMKDLGVSSVRELSIRNVNPDIHLTRKHLEGLEELKVEMLTIYGVKEITEDAFTPVPSILQLDLSGNRGLRLLDGIFHPLSKLKKLKLSNIGLNNLPERIFVLPDLEQLYMSRNKLNLTRSTFEGTKNLQLIDLSSNSLTVLPEDVFKPLTNLRNVDLSFNPLSTVSPDLFRYNTNLSQFAIKNVNDNIIENVLKTFNKNSDCNFVESEPKTFIRKCNVK